MSVGKVLYALDLASASLIHKKFGNHTCAKLTWEALCFTGDGIMWFLMVLPLLALMYLGGMLDDISNSTKVMVLSFYACNIVDIVGIVIMKLAFKRSRPPHHKTDGRFVGADQHSFPSGHATRAWCINGLIFSLSSGIVLFFHTVSLFYVLSNLTGGICIAYPSIIKEFFGIPISTVQPLFGIWACLICFGRIALGRHYPSDVLAGSLIGYFIEYPLTALILNGWVFPKQI